MKVFTKEEIEHICYEVFSNDYRKMIRNYKESIKGFKNQNNLKAVERLENGLLDIEAVYKLKFKGVK